MAKHMENAPHNGLDEVSVDVTAQHSGWQMSAIMLTPLPPQLGVSSSLPLSTECPQPRTFVPVPKPSLLPQLIFPSFKSLALLLPVPCMRYLSCIYSFIHSANHGPGTRNKEVTKTDNRHIHEPCCQEKEIDIQQMSKQAHQLIQLR